MLRPATLLLSMTAAFAQTPAFEAASVKVSTEGTTRSSIQAGGAQLTMTNVTLAALVLRAWDLKAYQLSAPDWLSARRYHVVAKLPPDATREQSNAMLQTLLVERFQLKSHGEERDVRGFDLVAGRAAHKLTPAVAAGVSPGVTEPPQRDAAGYPILTAPGLGFMEGVRGKSVVSFVAAKAQPVSALTELIAREFRMPVADRTGLEGVYDFRLEFAPQAPGALPPASLDAETASDPGGAPNLITAVQQQLGLRLVPAKVRVNVLVVDSAEPAPSGNE